MNSLLEEENTYNSFTYPLIWISGLYWAIKNIHQGKYHFPLSPYCCFFFSISIWFNDSRWTTHVPKGQDEKRKNRPRFFFLAQHQKLKTSESILVCSHCTESLQKCIWKQTWFERKWNHRLGCHIWICLFVEFCQSLKLGTPVVQEVIILLRLDAGRV